MSDLQIVLIILGALIIVGVLVYNWLQEKKLHNSITEEFIVPQKDVLVDDFYTDTDTDAYVDKALADDPHKMDVLDKLNEAQHKVLSTHEEALSTNPEDSSDGEPVSLSEHIEQTLGPEINEVESTFESYATTTEANDNEETSTVEEAVVKASNISDSTLPDDIHPHIDFTAILYAAGKINMQAFKLLSDAIEKDVGVTMMHVSNEDGLWYAIDDSEAPDSFKQAACCIQLADRAGPTAKHTLNRFQFLIENIGLELNTHVEWQDNSDAYAQATSLDKFCMEVDQLVNVHLVQDNAPVHGTKFKGLAEANGMGLGKDGRYYYPANASEMPQFVLINADHQPFTTESLRNNIVKRACFQIEVPKVASGEKTFIHMIDVAKKMAVGMDARIVDDNEKPLGQSQIDKIQQQLKVIHAKMVARGVMPGSKSTLRLFN